jgi:hypothetical protein
MITKLIVNSIEIPILKEIPVSLNLSIADIRDISKRGGSLTKTVIIPSTGVVDILFESVFRLNIELSTFNPNLKSEAIYYIDEKEQFKGDLQLLRIVDKPNGAREFHCNVMGREGSFFIDLGEKLLTDIDFSDLDHTYNKTEQKNSWATSYRKSGVVTPFAYGEGYVYPMIKYGNSASDTIFDVTHFKPAIPAREYMLRIFTDAGYEWTSSILDSAFFKHLYITCNREKIELTNAQVYSNQYYIGKTAATVTGWVSGTTNGSGVYSITPTPISPDYDLETVPYFDTSNQYDSVTNHYATILNSGFYNAVAFVQQDIKVNAPSLVGGFWSTSALSFASYIQKNTGSGWVTVAYINNNTQVPNTPLGTSYSLKSNCQTGSIYLNSGDLIRVMSFVNTLWNITTYNSGLAPTSAAFTIDYTFPNGAGKNEHYILMSSTTIADGNSLLMNQTIPVNIKQKDFVKSIFNLMNCYVELDKLNQTKLIIENRDAFYSGTVENWTKKIDYSKEFHIQPMGELDAINYVWKYKDDKDYYNEVYQKQYVDNYGQKKKTITNDFIRSEKKTELIFSPTPLVGNSSNNIICPHIYTKDSSGIKPLSHNIRLLYYGGLKNSGNPWTYTGLLSGTTSETQYPYIGHIDDPNVPTIDLNFDYPKEVYYTFLMAYFTNNNMYNKYYSQFINEITDKDSKLITCNVILDEIDVNNFSFRNKIYIEHPEYGSAYYIVNKIIDYNPLEYKSCKIELLKLKRYDAFIPGTISIDPSYDPVSSSRIPYNPIINDSGNTDMNNTLALGDNNRILGSGNVATGSSGCYVDETSSKINLVNCTNVSVIGVTNFVGIGLSNINIDSTYNGAVLNENINYNTSQSWELVTSNFNVNNDVSIYYVDCSGGDVTALFTASSFGDRVVCFTRIDNSFNKFKIDEITGLPSVIGNPLPYDTGMIRYDSIDISYYNNVFYIKG